MPSHILWTSQDLGEEQKYLSSLLGFLVQHLHPQCYISIIQKKQVVMLMEFKAVNFCNSNIFLSMGKREITFKLFASMFQPKIVRLYEINVGQWEKHFNDLPSNLVSSKHPWWRKSFVQSPISNDPRGSGKAGQSSMCFDCWRIVGFNE